MAQPTQTDPQFKLRLPQKLKDRIDVKAKKNNRSFNAEIVNSLEEVYPEIPDRAEWMAELTKLMEQAGSREMELEMATQQVDKIRAMIADLQYRIYSADAKIRSTDAQTED